MLKIKTNDELLRERGLNKGGAVQKYIDSEVIRCMDPFTPFRTGYLKKSATLGTTIGSGLIKYAAPYAREQYYNNSGRGTEGLSRGGKRGRYWFEHMKVIFGNAILAGAARISGGDKK